MVKFGMAALRIIKISVHYCEDYENEITNLQVTANKNIFQLNTSNWSAGSYVLMVKQNGNLLESKRFEIVH
jgi:hypothetical protein